MLCLLSIHRHFERSLRFHPQVQEVDEVSWTAWLWMSKHYAYPAINLWLSTNRHGVTSIILVSLTPRVPQISPSRALLNKQASLFLFVVLYFRPEAMKKRCQTALTVQRYLFSPVCFPEVLQFLCDYTLVTRMFIKCPGALSANDIQSPTHKRSLATRSIIATTLPLSPIWIVKKLPWYLTFYDLRSSVVFWLYKATYIFHYLLIL